MKVHQTMTRLISIALNNEFFILENVLVLRCHPTNDLASEGDQER